MSNSSPLDPRLQKTLAAIAGFFDARLKGHVGSQGFRKSTPLARMIPLIESMLHHGLIDPAKTVFLDLGCGDGRVNLLMSYFVKISLGVEIDDWTLDEAAPLEHELEAILRSEDLVLPPANRHLFHGDSLEPEVHDRILTSTGVRFEEVDVFYTFLTLYDAFAELIERRAGKGALFMVFGLDLVIPRLKGFDLIEGGAMNMDKAALYRKV